MLTTVGWQEQRHREERKAGLDRGPVDNGERSFERSLPHTADEIAEELLDVAGWAFIAWCRLMELRTSARIMCNMVRIYLFATLAMAACTTTDSTVEAFRYRKLIFAGAMDYVHGGGEWLDHLFLPSSGIHASVQWKQGVDAKRLPIGERQPVMHVWFGAPDDNPFAMERLSISAALAEQITSLAQKTKERDEFGSQLGKAAVDGAVVRGLESVKFRDDEPGAPGW